MDKKIIVALDGIPSQYALALAKQLKGLVWGFKVNDLLIDCGVEIISKLKHYGSVFADPKLHDIPNTVSNGVKRLQAAGADLITVHASGGFAMLEAAAQAAEQANILAVTVLTSLGEEDSQSIFGRAPQTAVLDFAGMAKNAGVSGIVCSPKELSILGKNEELAGLIKVIPGIRPGWYGAADDQKRSNTPAQALKDGANLLVIGRPITKHEDPAQAAKLIVEEIAQANAG